MAESNKKGGLKVLGYGCLGCFGVIILVVVIGGVMAGLAFRDAKSNREDEVLTQALPVPGSAPEGLSPDALASDMPDAAAMVGGGSPGRISLQLAGADFHVEPGRPGEPARVEASYNPRGYRLTEVFEPDDEGTWSYTVEFEPKGGSFFTKIGEMLSGNSPHVTIYLPADTFYDLDLDIQRGGADIDLGGLWLASADLDFAMGGGAFRKIGNASPRNLSVEFSMGGIDLNLSGDWKTDATISLSQSMGGGAVRLPDGVNIEGLGAAGKDRSGEEGPTLTFKVKSDMGDLEILN